MAANTAPIFPIAPAYSYASLAAATACTTRGTVAHASLTATPCFAVQLTQVTTNGRRVDAITVRGISTSMTAATVAQTVILWISDGVNAYPIDEIAVTAVTPSTTVGPFTTTKSYTTLVIPAGCTLWVSTTVTTTAATTALGVFLFGGDY